jgi:hypothetical protein
MNHLCFVDDLPHENADNSIAGLDLPAVAGRQIQSM